MYSNYLIKIDIRVRLRNRIINERPRKSNTFSKSRRYFDG